MTWKSKQQSVLLTFGQSNARWIFHIWVTGTVDPISFDLFRYNVHRATRAAILRSNFLLVVVGYVEKAG